MEIITFEHFDGILNIILFISTGSLTLVGLISFFSSITLQPKIVVARELLNQLEELINTKTDYTYGEKVINLLSRYKLISKSDLKFVHKLINITSICLIIIAFIWLSIACIAFPIYQINEWIYLSAVILFIIIIICCYIYLTRKLFNVFGLSSLPKYEELLNIDNNKQSMDMISLVGNSMMLQIDKLEDKVSIEVGFPIMFTGVTVIFNATSNISQGNEPPKYHNNGIDISFNLGEAICNRHLDDNYVWYQIKDITLDYQELNEYINFQLDLNTSNSSAKVCFYLLKSSMMSSDNYYKNCLIPSRVIVPICNQSDILSAD